MLDVYACTGPDGTPVGFDGFPRMTTTPAALYDDDCSSADSSPFAGMFLDGSFGAGTEAGWRINEPSELELTEVAWRGTVSDAGRGAASGWAGQIVASTETLLSATAPLARDLRQRAVPLAADMAAVRVRSGGDGAIADRLILGVEQLRARYADSRAPTGSNVRGAATTPGYKSGAIGLSFDAADIGAGVRYARMRVDGADHPPTLVDDNGGACLALPGSLHAFAVPVPCKRSVTGSVALDTTTMADGERAIELRLIDAGGNEAAVWTRTLRVNNPGGAVPDTACADGVDNDGDGRLDAGDDAGCSGPGDVSELAPPTSTTAPAVNGTLQSGQMLVHVPGAWDDGPGGGGATAIRWQAARYDGAAPVDIPGATGGTLELTDALVGRRIRVIETRTTSEGAASAASPLSSAAVVTADGTLPACADGKDNDDDNLIDRDADLGCSSRSDTTEDLTSPDEDRDGDGIPNRDDTDDDNDGTPDATDPRPFDPTEDGRTGDKTGQSDDFDNDGIVNDRDPDDDGDGVADADDPAPFDATIPLNQGSSHPTTIIIDRSTTTTITGPATNGHGGSNRAVVSVTGSQTRSLAYGRKTVMAGRLVNEHGQPISGAVMTLEEVTFVPGAGPLRGATFKPLVPAKPVTTDRDGRFRYLLPAKHSRIVRLGYKARTSDRDFTATQDLTLVVSSKATLKTNRSKLRNGQTVRFSGKVLGGRIPATGLQVVLEARTARGWVSFKTVRASRAGTFRSSYRFTATTSTRTYQFRARIRPDSSWPWKASTTRATKVLVRR